MHRFVPLLLVLVSLSACGSKIPFFQGPRFTAIDPNLTVEGPVPLINEAFEDIDLVCLLTTYTDTNNNVPECSEDNRDYLWRSYSTEYRQRLQRAINNFYKISPSSLQIRRRNGLQDHIIAASNQRCGQFKQFLKRHDTTANMTLGWLTTATAGIGTIFEAADTVRALAGTAAILSGWRAEFNEVLFHQRTIQVLSDGLEAKRGEIHRQILADRQGENGQAKDLDGYSVERAIGDAIRYHDNCSLLAGLEYAALSVQRAKDPGLNHLQTAFQSFREAQQEAVKIAQISETGVLQNTVFPANAFGEAEKAKERLKTISEKLATAGNTLSSLSAPDDTPKSTEIKRAQVDWTELTGEIEVILKGADDALTPEAKQKAEEIQNGLPEKISQIYASAADPAKQAAARAEFAIQIEAAEELELRYTLLAQRMERKAAEAQRLIQRIEDLKK